MDTTTRSIPDSTTGFVRATEGDSSDGTIVDNTMTSESASTVTPSASTVTPTDSIDSGLVLTLIEGENVALDLAIDANSISPPILGKYGGGELDRVMLSEGLDAIEFSDIQREDAGTYFLLFTGNSTTINITLIVHCKCTCLISQQQ